MVYHAVVTQGICQTNKSYKTNESSSQIVECLAAGLQHASDVSVWMATMLVLCGNTTAIHFLTFMVDDIMHLTVVIISAYVI